MTTVTLFTVTSRVCPDVRSMFFNLTYFDLLFLLRESLLEDLEPLAPGNWICVAACCWAATAELRRGLRVDVPKNRELHSVKLFKLFKCFNCYPTWTINLLIIFSAPTQMEFFTYCLQLLDDDWKYFRHQFSGISLTQFTEECESLWFMLNKLKNLLEIIFFTSRNLRKSLILPFLTSHIKHLKASAVFLNVQT